MMAACSHYTQTTRFATDAVAVIRVEFRNEPGVETEVLYLLRLSRVSDWEVNRGDAEITITARYQELPTEKAVEIGDRLKQLPFILDLDIRRDGVPVKNAS